MKYIRWTLPVLILAFLLQACAPLPEATGPAFYYLCAEPQYGQDGAIIDFEARRNADTDTQLRYLLALYFSGPIDDTLRSPFPDGTAVLDFRPEEDGLHLGMNGAFSQLSGIELTKACACIALTVFANSDTERVVIHFTDASTVMSRNMEFTRESLVLLDGVLPDQ